MLNSGLHPSQEPPHGLQVATLAMNECESNFRHTYLQICCNTFGIRWEKRKKVALGKCIPPGPWIVAPTRKRGYP